MKEDKEKAKRLLKPPVKERERMKRAHLETKINLQQNGAPKTKKPLRLGRKRSLSTRTTT